MRAGWLWLAIVGCGRIDFGSGGTAHGDASVDLGVSDQNLLGWWRLDDDGGTVAIDSSANANTLDLLSGADRPTWNAVGLIGGDLTFTGTSSYLQPGGGTIASVAGLGALTVSAWQRTAASQAAGTLEVHLVDQSECTGATDAGMFELAVSGSMIPAHKAVFLVYPAGGMPQVAVATAGSATSVDNGSWHLVTGVYSGTQVSLYIDGALESRADTPAFALSSAPLATFDIAGNCTGNGFYWPGDLDDVRIWGRALADAEVATLYDAGKPALVSSGLGGWWRLDEISGSVIDSSPTGGNTGSPTSGVGRSDVDGRIDGAATLANDGIDVGQGATITPTASATWTAWIYPTSLSGADEHVVARATGPSSSYQFKITSDCTSDTIGLLIEGASGFGERCGATSLPLNQWSFVAGVYDAASQTFDVYLNGAVNDGAFLGTFPPAIVPSTVDVELGNSSDLGYPFVGKLDDVRIYTRALSAAEIAKIYAGDF